MAHPLVRALENERTRQKQPFVKAGLGPGPEPVVRLDPKKVLVDREGKTLYIGFDDLIKVVSAALPA